jgi:hypothetical protein
MMKEDTNEKDNDAEHQMSLTYLIAHFSLCNAYFWCVDLCAT